MQNLGLRIVLGAMGSTPIQQMGKIEDLQPFECRREYKAAIQGEKLKRLTSHPLRQKLQHGTKNQQQHKNKKQKNTPEKKELQAQVEGPTKGMLIFWRQIQESVRNSRVSGHHRGAFQKSELKFKALQQREHRLQSCG